MTTADGLQKIDDALTIIRALELPREQQNERSALTLLALLDLPPGGRWPELRRPMLVISPRQKKPEIRSVMGFCAEHYGREYAPNSRETFRRYTLHQFVADGVALYNPDRHNSPTTSPKTCYQISPEVFALAQTFGTAAWELRLADYLRERKTLAAHHARPRDLAMIPLQGIGGLEIRLTPGAHSELIRSVITEFAPRFAPGAELIYVGDTGDKTTHFQEERLAELGVILDPHGKMPDVVLYLESRNWLLVVEAVTSHGPVNAKRHEELAALFAAARPGLVYVTAFPDRRLMARYLVEISWETEVWCADAPSHLIHFDGERFLGPYG